MQLYYPAQCSMNGSSYKTPHFHFYSHFTHTSYTSVKDKQHKNNALIAARHSVIDFLLALSRNLVQYTISSNYMFLPF